MINCFSKFCGKQLQYISHYIITIFNIELPINIFSSTLYICCFRYQHSYRSTPTFVFRLSKRHFKEPSLSPVLKCIRKIIFISVVAVLLRRYLPLLPSLQIIHDIQVCSFSNKYTSICNVPNNFVPEFEQLQIVETVRRFYCT